MKHHHRYFRQTIYLSLLLILLGIIIFSAFFTQAQANPVTITSITVFCDHVELTFTTAGITDADQVDFVVRGPGNPYLGGIGVTGVGPAGNPHFASIYFEPPQPNGTMLTVEYGLPANPTTYGPVACGSSGPPPPPTEPPPPSETEGEGGWDGYDDDRLSPDPAENYSLYCANDNLHVWANDDLLASIPITQLLAIDYGSFIQVNNLIIRRRNRFENSPDIFVVSGNIGNNSPDYGEKSFNMADCLARNGPILELNDDDDEEVVVAPTGNQCLDAGANPQITLSWSVAPNPSGFDGFGQPNDFIITDYARRVININIADASDAVSVTIQVFNNLNQQYARIRLPSELNADDINTIFNTTGDGVIDGYIQGQMPIDHAPLQLQINSDDTAHADGADSTRIVITVIDEIGCTSSETIVFRVIIRDEILSGDAAFFIQLAGLIDDLCGMAVIGLMFIPMFWIQRRKRRTRHREKSSVRFP